MDSVIISTLSDVVLLQSLPADEITQNAFCSRCEYNLRGLTWSGRCPECGTLTEHSRWRFTLSNTNPKWVQTQRDGVLYLFAGFTAAAVTYPIGYAGVSLGFLVLPAVNTLLNFMGAWRLTTRNADKRLTTPAPRLRILIRICAILDCVNLLIWLGGFGGGFPFFIFYLLHIIIFFEARCLYLIYLSRRFEHAILRRKMTWQLVIIMIGLPLASAMSFSILMFLGSLNLKFGSKALVVAAVVFTAVFCVWYAGLLIRYALALNASLRASSQGEGGWAQGTVVA